jgi:hypothetical protein
LEGLVYYFTLLTSYIVIIPEKFLFSCKTVSWIKNECLYLLADYDNKYAISDIVRLILGG